MHTSTRSGSGRSKKEEKKSAIHASLLSTAWKRLRHSPSHAAQHLHTIGSKKTRPSSSRKFSNESTKVGGASSTDGGNNQTATFRADNRLCAILCMESVNCVRSLALT